MVCGRDSPASALALTDRPELHKGRGALDGGGVGACGRVDVVSKGGGTISMTFCLLAICTAGLLTLIRRYRQYPYVFLRCQGYTNHSFQ